MRLGLVLPTIRILFRQMAPPEVAVAAMGSAMSSVEEKTPFHVGLIFERQTYMARLIIRMDECLSSLGIDTADDKVLRKMESMAIGVHESMSISSRNYHSVQHVFDITKDIEDPIAILAAIFHDCVYYHVDGGFSDYQASMLEGAVQPSGSNDCTLTDDPETLLCLCRSVFGFTPGQVLSPMTGVNEFLSAVLAVRELEPLLEPTILAQIAACIELTIPFRPRNEQGSPAERLYQRMIATNAEFDLKLDNDQLVQAVQRAVILANEDVGNFGTDDRGLFLDNTWNLLPESNAALRHQYLYTVEEFQFALFKMYGFFGFLQPSVIFSQFRNVPNDEELARRTLEAGRNLEIGRRYIGAKLLSLSVLAAIAELTGGDAPITLFMGDLPSRHRVSGRMEDTLPRYSKEVLAQSTVKVDWDVYRLLLYGRKSETSFDIKQSPLAAYLYAYLGDEETAGILKDIKTYPMNSEVAWELLARLPFSAIGLVGENMAAIAPSRSERILAILEDLRQRS